MEDFINNQGLSLISEDIFSLVDISDLINCMKVCKLWQKYLIKGKKIWIRSLQHSKYDLQSIQKLDKNTRNGEIWLQTFSDIEKNGDITDIIELSKIFNLVDTLYPAEDYNSIGERNF